MDEHQQLTKYIKHLVNSANFKAVTLNKNCGDLTGLLSEMPNAPYSHRCCPILRLRNFRVNRNRMAKNFVYTRSTMYICNTYCDIKMAAGLSAELNIKTKNTDKELSRLVGSSYFFI